MEFEGKIWKSKTSKYWLAEVPSLDVMTQGTSYKNAIAMIQDAIEMLLVSYFPHEPRENIRITVTDYKGGNIGISAQDGKLLLAFSLRRQRIKSGATVREVAERLGSKSPNSYAPYERGEKKPSLDKFEQLIQAVNPSKPLRLRIA